MQTMEEELEVMVASQDEQTSEELEEFVYCTGDYDYEWGFGSMTKCIGKAPFGNSIGRMTACFRKSEVAEGEFPFLCVAGPCWPMIIFTSGLILGVGFALFSLIRNKASLPFLIIQVVLTLGTFISFLATALTNPGIGLRYPNRPANLPVADVKYNPAAKLYIPSDYEWCEECLVSIRDNDHFCPWTGTTIAGGNMSQFCVFLCMLCTTLCYTIAIVMVTTT